jgi:mono/diheme cytochrome c family protein
VWSGAVLALAGAPSGATAQEESSAPAQRESSHAARAIRDGAALQQRCARCHDADGTGKSSRANLREIPDFSSHKWQSSRSDAELLVSILDGKGSHMPGFRGKISEDAARDLVAVVRAIDPTPAAKLAARGSQDDFEHRFRQLQDELAELKKQFKDLDVPRRKP